MQIIAINLSAISMFIPSHIYTLNCLSNIYFIIYCICYFINVSHKFQHLPLEDDTFNTFFHNYFPPYFLIKARRRYFLWVCDDLTPQIRIYYHIRFTNFISKIRFVINLLHCHSQSFLAIGMGGLYSGANSFSTTGNLWISVSPLV